MIIYLGQLSPVASSNLPKAGGPRQRFCSVLLRMGFTYALPVAREAVVSYTALPTLPAHGWRYISVALSLESPPPDVIRHPALWSPDFPHLTPFGIVSREHLPYLRLFILAQSHFTGNPFLKRPINAETAEASSPRPFGRKK